MIKKIKILTAIFFIVSLFSSNLFAEEGAILSDSSDISFQLYHLNVTNLYQEGKYQEARKMAQDGLNFARTHFKTGDSNIAFALTDLARMEQELGSSQAEALHQEALRIWNQDKKYVREAASSLTSLALIYQEQGDYEKSENYFKQGWEIRKKEFGSDDSSTAVSLNNLAGLYRIQNKSALAEQYYLEALRIWEKTLLPGHPALAKGYNNLAVFYESQGKHIKALTLFEKALKIKKNLFGENHPQIAVSFYNIAGVYQSLGRLREAESFLQAALTIWEKSLGAQNTHTEQAMRHLTLLAQMQKKEK